VRDLTGSLSPDSPPPGTERIRGERHKLGSAASTDSIRRYRGRGLARSPSQTWRTFLRNHAAQIWAADLSTVPTVTFRTLSVPGFITHDRRELGHCPVTAHPTSVRTERRLAEATAQGRRPRHLVRDRDTARRRPPAHRDPAP
jgi:hypothetical protein